MTPTPQASLLEASLATALAPFGEASGILVAVSGGPDSMALLRLVAGWAEHRDHPPIHAATVDHRLRPGSRSEAEAVADWAAALGVPHAILTWEGDKPATRIQERARQARYGLLAEHAARIGADLLLTAHHADDQAETVLFRLLRGSNITGLAGMAPLTYRGEVRHLRPLLTHSKAELVAFCEAAAQPYVRDPSNEDPRYARTRMRRLCAQLAEEGFGRAAVLRLSGRLARAEAALAEATQVARARLPAERTATSFAAEAPDLADLAEEILLRILIGEVERVGEPLHPPRLERTEALLARLLPALRRNAAFAGTLGGTVIRLDAGRLTIAAEQRKHRRNPAHERSIASFAERKIDPSRREDQCFPWQGTTRSLN